MSPESYALALDALKHSGSIRAWRMSRGPGAGRGRRTWELELPDGSVWRMERYTLDAVLAMASSILREGAVA